MRIAILYLIMALVSINTKAIELDTEFERAICDELIKQVPKQRGRSIWFDTPVSGWDNPTNWTYYSESCSVEAESFDYDNVVIHLFSDKYYTPVGSTWTVPYHTQVDASIRCLITSNYEWECLYQEAHVFDAQFLRIVLQQRTGVTDSTWFKDAAPSIFLNTAKEFMNQWY